MQLDLSDDTLLNMTEINDLLMANKGALKISGEIIAENQSESFIAFIEITKTIPCGTFPLLNYVHLFWTSCGEIPGFLLYIVLTQFVKRKVLFCVSCFVASTFVYLILLDTDK
ncbi:hypothetical protein TNCT_118941 [Trichonephila clavata]|uniref:Uncharacterized protein n=1 Tax=Trichonephila clavata TaxID=2740835 RepID=A0A8X6JYS8_TRICU|nr:hypothetical protein TNCT_118941 [Trichonephila clavata]